ncbi:glycosyl transferase [Carbonactinospora thermoautotrophica]|uniref:Glycosyl transferase n=2 Tax=Carbonactinospora thermoautotrophica TaxID=1469144 RepID=A0A132MYY2_9ACTN|nr:glycosyltransferase [Carbonactinospora thermoautotrophica]KWW97979.1 glycosyl transferase [Carbonactinospora thermoautotrophica]KWX03108.1 putative transferase [Carbonactinospora thermoautotrophica]
MKIAMVSEHASPLATIGGVDAGGQNVHVASLSQALARRGHEVTVYTRRDSRRLPRRIELCPGLVVEHVPAGPPRELPKDDLLPYMPEFGRYLAARWAEDTPDIVHSHFWMSGLAALAGACGLGIPVVHTYHALGVVKRRYQGAKDTSPPGRIRLERAIGHDVERIIATCSDEVFELVRMGVNRRRISVIPCGVDLDRFSPEGPAWPRGDRPRLLVVSRLVERKGIDVAIQALPRIPDAELLIAGGPPRDRLGRDPEVRRLMAIAARYGVSDRVEFLGAVPREEIPALYRSADLLITTPWYEPFGITPLEAMACGVPVVAAAVGGLIDTVVDGSTGVHVPPRRPDALAVAVRRLLADPVRRDGYGIAGADRARVRYGWDRIAADVENVYTQVVQARRPAIVPLAR